MKESPNILLEARSVNFAYACPVVRDLTLSLQAGTMTGIIGPNGSGKTTALRLLDGILRPSSGEVILTGIGPLSRLKRRQIARHIAMVPQNGGLYLDQTLLEFTIQGRAPHLPFLGFETVSDEEIALAALELTQLSRYRARRVWELSGGEKQRLLLARALTQRTRILLLDEFTANLDINYQVELMRLVSRITREQGVATLVVSHEINLMAAFSDHIVLMSDGAIRHQGPVTEVITEENLKKLFGLSFRVRPLPSGVPEVLPIMHEGY